MSVTTIQRDTNNNVSLVRMTTTDSLATVASTNYIANQQENINVLNGGVFAWFLSDMVLVAASDGNAFYYFKSATFATLVIYGEQGSGTVNPGLINQVAYYAANGSSISGLTTLASGVLVTSAGGVPSISQTLPATVQGNITALGTITSGVWNGTPLTVPYGGTGNTTFTAYTVICAGTTATGTFQNVVSVGNSGDVFISNGAGALPTFQAGVASGIINTGNLNDLPYYSANPSGKTLSAIAGAASSVLITSGLGVPSLSQTLPSAVQGNITALGTIATGVWNGSVISPTYGGTGLSNPTAHGVMIGEGASNMTPIVLGAGQVLIGTTASDPTAAAINSGTGILVGNASGSITVSLASIADQRVLANISGGSAAPVANSLSAIIDACIGSTQGDILYRGAATWSVLAPSTSGFALITGGAAANPSWAAVGAVFTPAALTKTDDTNVTLTLGGTPATALLQATSLTLGWTGLLSMARGGTNANLTAANGAIPYSTTTAIALLAAGSSGQLFQSGGVGAPNWTTSTYPATNAANTLLYASSANVMAALATANSGVLVTNGSGVPSISSTLPTVSIPSTSNVKFSAYTAGHANVTGDGTSYLAILESTYINTGTAYSTSTGLFTAPTTGTYLFTASIALSGIGAGHTAMNGWFQQSGSASIQYYISDESPANTLVSAEVIYSGATVIYLVAADTVSLNVTVSNSTKTVNLAAQALFGGFLIG